MWAPSAATSANLDTMWPRMQQANQKSKSVVGLPLLLPASPPSSLEEEDRLWYAAFIGALLWLLG